MKLSWKALHDYSKKVGIALGFIALGAAGDGIYNGTAKLPWLHQQAAAVAPLKGALRKKTYEAAEAHCERDVALSLAVAANGGVSPDVHCPAVRK